MSTLTIYAVDSLYSHSINQTKCFYCWSYSCIISVCNPSIAFVRYFWCEEIERTLKYKFSWKKEDYRFCLLQTHCLLKISICAIHSIPVFLLIYEFKHIIFVQCFKVVDFVPTAFFPHTSRASMPPNVTLIFLFY